MAEDKRPTIYKTWDDGFCVRSMTDDDAKIAQQWFSEICYISCDLQVALKSTLYEGGFYVGEYRGEIVASAIRIQVADGIFYGTYYYVVNKYRHKGFGRRIRDGVARQYVGDNILAIDGMKYLVEMNKRHGYNEAFDVSRFAGKVPAQWECSAFPDTMQISSNNMKDLIQYDNKCFIKPNSNQRKSFLYNLINIQECLCIGAVDKEGSLIGYGCRRPAIVGNNYIVGPLYADSYEVAYAIIHKLFLDFGGSTMVIDVCLHHKEAVKLTEKLGLKENTKMVRMYLNGHPGELSPRVYGLTSVEACGF